MVGEVDSLNPPWPRCGSVQHAGLGMGTKKGDHTASDTQGIALSGSGLSNERPSPKDLGQSGPVGGRVL